MEVCILEKLVICGDVFASIMPVNQNIQVLKFRINWFITKRISRERIRENENFD
jgi:hypothetical protein